MLQRLARWFEFEPRGATWRGELMGGTTTFLTMSYIVIVQPTLLAQAGMDFGAVLVATCLSSAVATLIMGLWAKYPVALAPGMGENFFMVYGVVLGSGLLWTEALSAVFYAGLIFILLSLTGAREAVLNAFPDSLKTAAGIGIGLFIAFIGFSNAGLVVSGAGVPVALGDMTSAPVLLALVGLAITVVLYIRRIPGAILWGILVTGLIATLTDIVAVDGVVSAPPSLAPTFGRLDWTPTVDSVFLAAVFVFLFMDVVDTTGTLAAIGRQSGFFRNGRLPRAGRAFLADSIGTTAGAVLGTSTVTSYIESAAGIAAGARTGAANLIVSAGFILALFFHPIARAFGGGVTIGGGAILYPITAPALMLVGALMARLTKDIPWDDPTEAIPAFLVIVGVPLTYSIPDGLSLGFVFYPIVKLVAGRIRDVHPVFLVVSVAAVTRYVVL